MDLRARIIEGTDVWYSREFKNGKYILVSTRNEDICITAKCLRPQDAFNALYDLGKFLWDANLCSKYEIAAFEGKKMFWKHRPDYYNFKLELEYVQDYQKRFWDNKTTFCSVETFKPTVRTTLMLSDASLDDKIVAATADESTSKGKQIFHKETYERE